MLGESRRDSLEGFQPEGVAQVKRELDQIILEVRYHLLAVPREAARQYRQLQSAPGPAVFISFQLMLPVLVVWLLAGAFVVEWIDATASRQGFSSGSSSRLRFRSLRLVGMGVVAIGLILSLTVATVGKGAIYAWVISTSWFLAVSVFLVLVVWWKDTIFERMKGRDASRVLQ